MTIYYMDYELGNDASSGSSWDSAWQTFTNGATAARVAPGDVIRIAKSASPTNIGTATWTNLSKTVTLTSGSLNPNIDRCEVAWTANPSGDTTVALTGVATDAKEGSNCMKLTLDASPQTNVMQAYKATGTLDLSAYQKISFWFKNSAATISTDWIVQLCADTAGSSVVDSFPIPAVPSTARWIPLTLARTGGGNCGSAIQSISISTGNTAPTASSNILVDNFIACTSDGLNLQSLISKSSLESGGTQTWHVIQSINQTTILLDNETATKATQGKGYFGISETVTLYKRETIKTSLAASATTIVNNVADDGNSTSYLEFQGGYNRNTNEQDGETFFDGLNGQGYGIHLSSKAYVLLNRISAVRYNYNFRLASTNLCLIDRITSSIGSQSASIYLTSTTCNNTINTIIGCNNNGSNGIYMDSNSNNNQFISIISANNNLSGGIAFQYSCNSTFTTIGDLSNNSSGINSTYSHYHDFNTITRIANNPNGACNFTASSGFRFGSLTTTGNNFTFLVTQGGKTIIDKASFNDSTLYSYGSYYDDCQVLINNINGYSSVLTDYGTIVSQNASAGGTGKEWKMSITGSQRRSRYPLKLKLAEFALLANTQAIVSCYFKKSHATDIGASLVCPGYQLNGISETTTVCPSDTNRNLLTIKFTPTESGVVRVEAWAWYIANTADENVIIDDISIAQG